ncbi:MAG TPA: protein kinase [Steroidobacteraceae bacterium]|nr:protein kinase [Steroidobacteraceae bacterium]
MTLTRDQMAQMSRLLDEALPLTDSERRVWLDNLPSDCRGLAELLREALLPSDAAAPGPEQLATIPKIGIVEDVDSLPNGLEPGARVGPYELIRPLGAGGMAEVWLARRADGALKREVALKLPLLMRVHRDLPQRFVRERDILAGLEHPNIARLYDAGFAADGQPYLALEYVVGKPITEYCDEHRLSVRQRLELFRQVLSAVQYAHAHLVIHRDLKPSNILVTEEGQVELLDFGIAKLLSDGHAHETQLTQFGARALTPDYAAPEQIMGTSITTAADVYGLGVILYELLSGARPYRLRRDSRGALEEAILQVEPVAPSRLVFDEAAAGARGTTPKRLARTLKGDLDTIVVKALKKSPQERYATASEFGEDIARHLSGEAVLARPDSLVYLAVKFARRHRLAIGVAAVVLLTLAGGLAATSYEAEVASVERDAALRAQLRSLTQIAAARLTNGDAPGAMSIILDVLPHRGAVRSYTPEALTVFHESRVADTEIQALIGHRDSVISAAFSPDGGRIVTASLDRTARIWDAATGRQTLQLAGHTDRVLAARFSPDGRRVVTASRDASARIWDAVTGRELARLIGHSGTVWSADFSPDGRRVVTASRDKTARIWDAASGEQIGILNGHTDVVRSAAFSPDGERIVTASYDKTARIWDAASGRQIRVLTGHTDLLLCAAFSPDGWHVVTASVDTTARTWDAATGQQILLLGGGTNWVSSAAFSPDGSRIVTAAYDKTARIWDAANGALILRLSGHRNWLSSAAFSPDGQRIVTASHDHTARVWDSRVGEAALPFTGHASWVADATFSPDGRRIVSASYDKTARIWDAATGQTTVTLAGHTDGVNTATFSPDGRRVLTSSNDGTARLWDATTGEELKRLGPYKSSVNDATFSPDGRQVLTSSHTIAEIWDSETGRAIRQLKGHSDEVFAAVYSPDGRRIVTASWDKTARIWDSVTGRQVAVLAAHTEQLIGAAFSSDGRRIVTTSHDKTARIWDASSGRELTVLSGHTDTVETAVFSPNGERLATASDDGTARLWDTANGRLVRVLRGHNGQVFSAAFAPDGRSLVTASSDKTIRLWDARTIPLEVQLAWAEVAQFDPPSSTERYELGLSVPSDVRRWTAASACDRSASAPYDPDRRAAGVRVDEILTDIALAACAVGPSGSGDARSLYQHGRALVASGRLAAAGADFAQALARGYRSAGIDLAMLLTQPSAGMLDGARAIRLYEQAWTSGVTISAYELGNLYEHGIADDRGGHSVVPDAGLAQSWYSRGAAAGEPHALAYLAQRTEGGDLGDEPGHARLLESYRLYAAASERARTEDWPDGVWRDWRYHRASLARILARAGMMPQVAELSEKVRRQYAPPAPRGWGRLSALFLWQPPQD